MCEPKGMMVSSNLGVWGGSPSAKARLLLARGLCVRGEEVRKLNKGAIAGSRGFWSASRNDLGSAGARESVVVGRLGFSNPNVHVCMYRQ